MKKQIKNIALITTGLVVGMVMGRESKKISKPTAIVKIADLPKYKELLNKLNS